MKQIIIFGLVGVVASLTHFLLVFAQVEWLGIAAIIANIFAFLCAYPVSYFGHSSFTFKKQEHSHQNAIKKFFYVACLGFCLNEGGYFLLLQYTDWHYLWSLFLILAIVPILTFVLAKFWAFQS